MSEDNNDLLRDLMTKDITVLGRGRRLVICTICGKKGSLVLKSTMTKGKSYKYYCIEHSSGRKKSWHYLGKFEDLPVEYRNILEANP